MSDTEILDFIQRNDAWLTHASELAGTNQEWRCMVSGRHFAKPDIRERASAYGYGRTPREAVCDAMKPQSLAKIAT